jgi:hypothetical protein
MTWHVIIIRVTPTCRQAQDQKLNATNNDDIFKLPSAATMKSPPGIFLLSYLLLQSTDSSQAFFVREGRSSITSTTRTTVLFESDSPHKQAIQVALEASKKFGATSPEARVAWDIAEEVENSFFSTCSKR